MKKKKILLLSIIVIITLSIIIVAIVIMSKENHTKTNNLETIYETFYTNYVKSNNNSNTEKISNFDVNTDNNYNIEGMENVSIIRGLRIGGMEKAKIFMQNNEYFVSTKTLEEILDSDMKISYNNNILKIYYNVKGYEDSNTFFTMNMKDGIMKGKTADGYSLEDEKIANLPIIVDDELFLPLKNILERIQSGKAKIYYDEELKKLRISLMDFEIEFLKNFPYPILGGWRLQWQYRQL